MLQHAPTSDFALPTSHLASLITILGRHHAGTEAAYGRYMAGSVPLMQRYRVGIEAVGPGVASPLSTETWPVNIVISFPDADHADGFFRDPGYVHIKEAYRDQAYAEISLALFTADGAIGQRSPGALSITQAEIADGGAYDELRAAIAPLARDAGVHVLASGPGYPREYTSDVWPVNTLLGFRDAETLAAFFADSRVEALSDLRARAYGRHRITTSAPRAPRVEVSSSRPAGTNVERSA